MMVYISSIILILVCYGINGRYVIRYSDYLDTNRSLKRTKRDMIIIGAVLLILVAFRSNRVGLDTWRYVQIYNYRDFASWIKNSRSWLSGEIGYQLLQFILRSIGFDYQSVTIIEGLIYIIPVFAVIHRYSHNPYYSVFLFLAFDYYLFSMTAIRQTFAIGFVMIAFLYANKKKFVPFLVFVVLAISFHMTAIVAIPIYFIAKMPMKRKFFVYAVVIGLLTYIFQSPIRAWMRQFARIDYGNLSTGGIGMYLLMLSVILIDLFDKKDESYVETETDTLIRYMMIAAVVIYPVLRFHPSAFRLHYYYSIMMIVYLPNVIRSINNKITSISLGIGYTIVAVYYMFTYSFNQFGAVPYYFFWNTGV